MSELSEILKTNDSKQLCQYLRDATTPSLSWSVLTPLLQQAYQHAKQQQPKPYISWNPAATLMELPKLSFLTPRSKFSLHFQSKQLIVVNTQQEAFAIPSSQIQQVIKLPIMEILQPTEIATYVYIIQFKEPWLLKQKSYPILVFQLNKKAKEDEMRILDTQWKQGLVDTTSKCFVVKCYWNTSNGKLYFFTEGVFFMSPSKLILLSEVERLDYGRASSPKTFDLQFTFKDNNRKPIEFTMIEREEFSRVEQYVETFQQHSSKAQTTVPDTMEQQHEASSEEDDSPYESQSDEGDVSEPLSGDAESESEEENDDEEEEEEEDDEASSSTDEEETKPIAKKQKLVPTSCPKENNKPKATLEAHGFFVKRTVPS